MNDAALNRLIELSWRSKLTVGEQEEVRGLLAAHPDWEVTWRKEVQLTRGLQELPNVAVPSNFTARVLQSIELEERGSARAPSAFGRAIGRFQRGWLPRLAFGAVIVTAGLLTYRHEHQILLRREYAQSVAAVSGVASLPSPEILENFEAIRQLNNTPAPDEQLLAILQ
jgi:hypothetical protein